MYLCAQRYRRQTGNKKSGCPVAASMCFWAGWSGTQSTMSTWWQRIRRASPSQQPCPSGRPQSQKPSQVPFPSPPLRSLTVQLNSQKTEEQNSKLRTRASRSSFTSLALKGDWQLNKSTEKIDFLDSSEPEMIFRHNFLTLKFWQPLLNELEFALAELGQAVSTEDEIIKIL